MVIGCNLKCQGSLLNEVGVGLLKQCRIPSEGAALHRQMWLGGCLNPAGSLTFADLAIYSRPLWRGLDGLGHVIMHHPAGLELMGDHIAVMG